MEESESPLRAIFLRALEIADAHQRAAYLAEACAGNAAQRKLLEELLEAHAQADAFLATHGASMACTGDAAQRKLLEELLEAHPQAGGFLAAHENAEVPPTAGIREAAGSVIGRYKLLQKIGEGGCGAVYMAEQEEPVRRRVALKIIKPGMDTRQVIARFEAERQALALMEHPNIAKVFDAGTTDTGRPFFVMELVRGVKITEYCDEARLSTQQRLELFIQVCRAVQHAHQKGIIHRDLKPSNILVTLNDGVPVPKIIDFGIAKAITGSIAAALVIGLGVSTVLLAKERRALHRAMAAEKAQSQLRQQAESEAAKARQVSQLLKDMLKGAGPSVALGRDTTLLKEILDKTAQRLGAELTNQPEVEVELRLTLTRIYSDLGLYPQMQEMASNALAVARSRLPPGSPRLRKALGEIAWALEGLGRLEDAYAVRQQAVALTRAQGTNQVELAWAMADLALNAFRRGKLDEAEPLAREALALHRRCGTNDSSGLENVLNVMGRLLRARGKFDEAEAAFRESLDVVKKELGNEHFYVAVPSWHLANVLLDKDKLEEAETLAREALAIETKALGSNGISFSHFLTQLAVVLAKKGDRQAAEQLFKDYSRPGGSPHINIRRARGEFLARTGQWKAAIAEFTSILELEPTNHLSYHCLAPLLVAGDELDGYRQLCQQIVDRFGDTTDGPTGRRMAKACLILPGSGPDLKIIGKMADQPFTAHPTIILDTDSLACKSLAEYRQGRLESAVQWAEKVTSMNLWGTYPDVEALMVMAMAQYQLRHSGDARAPLVKGRTMMKTHLPKLESESGVSKWIDWLISSALIREAEALIEGNPIESRVDDF